MIIRFKQQAFCCYFKPHYIPYRGIVNLQGRQRVMQENTNIQPCENCSLYNDRTTMREDKLKTNLISRLNRIEGQIRGIKGMIEKDAYCDDILNQVSAVQSALDAVGKIILENHIRGCVAEKIKQDDGHIVDELIETIGRLLR